MFLKMTQIMRVSCPHNGGSAQFSSLSSSRDVRTESALEHFSGSVLLSGTMTTFIPAALPASTPLGASSNTRTCVEIDGSDKLPMMTEHSVKLIQVRGQVLPNSSITLGTLGQGFK